MSRKTDLEAVSGVLASQAQGSLYPEKLPRLRVVARTRVPTSAALTQPSPGPLSLQQHPALGMGICSVATGTGQSPASGLPLAPLTPARSLLPSSIVPCELVTHHPARAPSSSPGPMQRTVGAAGLAGHVCPTLREYQ